MTLKIKQGGTEVRSISLSRSTGEQQTTWDGRDNSGSFVSGGIFVATLEVVGGSNTHFSNGHQVTVFTPPVAHIGDVTVAYLNTKVIFDGSGSYDPDDGTGSGLGITTWSWSFIGGTPASVTTTTSGVPTTYNSLGEKVVTLTVTDNEGETNSTTRTISVIPPPPVADAGENQTVALNTTAGNNGGATTSVTVNFDGSGSYDPDDSGDSTVVDKGITKWKWKFPDGNPATAETKTPSTTYTTAVGFSVLGAKDATAWSWSWSAPTGAGNNPTVSFSTPTSNPSTVNNAKWFAFPNVTCSRRTSTYTIQCAVTAPNGSTTAEAHLSVSIPEIGGTTTNPTVEGFTFDNQSGDSTKPWRLQPNSVSRTEPSVAINVRSNSQFYNKVSIHEAEHVKQWKTGFMNSYFTVNSFLNYVTNSGVKTKDLKTATQQSIIKLVRQAYRNWYLDQYNQASQPQNRIQMERDAYNVSDAISPQYLYQGECHGY